MVLVSCCENSRPKPLRFATSARSERPEILFDLVMAISDRAPDTYHYLYKATTWLRLWVHWPWLTYFRNCFVSGAAYLETFPRYCVLAKSSASNGKTYSRIFVLEAPRYPLSGPRRLPASPREKDGKAGRPPVLVQLAVQPVIQELAAGGESVMEALRAGPLLAVWSL